MVFGTSNFQSKGLQVGMGKFQNPQQRADVVDRRSEVDDLNSGSELENAK